MKNNTEIFISKSKQKFGEFTFDYSKTIYKSSKNLVTIICPIHGEMSIIASSHLKSKTGCEKCSRNSPNKPVLPGIKRKAMREYHIWKGMKNRTTNPNASDYSRYGARGIKVCEEWLNSFEMFYEDMGFCPKNFTLDRIDPNGNYCKENCRWASKEQQAKNRGNFNIQITYNNKTQVLTDWAKEYGIKYTTLYQRLFRTKMTFE